MATNVTPAPTVQSTLIVPDDATIERTLVVYPALFLVSVAFYFLLKQKYPEYFILRTDSVGHEEPDRYLNPGLLRHIIFSLKTRIFIAITLEEDELIARIGLDQYIVLRLIRLIIFILAGFNVLGLFFLLPIYRHRKILPGSRCSHICARLKPNITGEDPYSQDSCLCNFVDQSSLANLNQRDDLLWCPVLAMYVATFWTLWLLRREYKITIQLRKKYWMNRPPELYTVFVDEIPPHLGLSTRQALFEHFDSIFPGEVARVDIVGCKGPGSAILRRLRNISQKRNKCFRKLERLVARYHRDSQYKSLMHLDLKKLLICRFDYIDSWQYYQTQLAKLNETFAGLIREYKLESEKFDPLTGSMLATAAFVTMKSARASVIATQALIHDRKNIVVVPAVEPSNVRYASLGYSEAIVTCNRYMAQGIYLALLVLWGSLVAAVSLATTSSALESQFPIVKDVLHRNPELRRYIDMAAPLVIILLLALVNPLINELAKLHSRCSETEIENISTLWYFVFLVVQVFLFYGISKNIWSSLQRVVETPKMIFSILASNIPKNAAFYIDFIIVKLFSMLSLDLLRVTSFLQHWVRRFWFGKDITVYDFKAAKCGCYSISTPVHNNLSSLAAQLLLIYFIAATYLTIQPLIAPVALVFFALAYLVYGIVFVNCNLRRYDSGGLLWPILYWCIMSALFTSQATLLGVLALKQGYGQLAPLWLLIFFTAGSSSIINKRYLRLVISLPLSVAAEIDVTATENVSFVEPSHWLHGILTKEPNYLKRGLKYGQLSAEVSNNNEELDSVNTLQVYDYSIPELHEPNELEISQTLQTFEGPDAIQYIYLPQGNHTSSELTSDIP